MCCTPVLGPTWLLGMSTLIGKILFMEIAIFFFSHICGPLTPTALGGYKYFITFIDDFSRFGYVELIHEKSDSLNVFKAFMAKVEL